MGHDVVVVGLGVDRNEDQCLLMAEQVLTEQSCWEVAVEAVLHVEDEHQTCEGWILQHTHTHNHKKIRTENSQMETNPPAESEGVVSLDVGVAMLAREIWLSAEK